MEFGGQVSANVFVGEATSLPRDTTLRNGECSGEFVQISNILPFNQPLEYRKAAGGCSLPYRGLDGNRYRVRFISRRYRFRFPPPRYMKYSHLIMPL